MIRLASVINTFEADFLTHYRHRLTSDHTRALAAIKQCRTAASPKMQVKCTGCKHQQLMPHSCGHRHCPHCQHHESQQEIKGVSVEYFTSSNSPSSPKHLQLWPRCTMCRGTWSSWMRGR